MFNEHGSRNTGGEVMNNHEVTFIIIGAILFVFLVGGTGFGMMGYGGMMGGYYGGFGFMWLFGSIVMVLFTVALVLLILWLVKQLSNQK